MFALFSRILKLAGPYKGRIQGAFACAFVESILSKMPIFLAFVVLSGFAAGTLTGQTCLYVGLGLAAAVLVQMLVHYLSDSLQSAAGYLMFAEKRMELGGHLRKLPMGYFTSGNIGKISSVLSTDMVFIEEVAMSTLGNMMSYLLSSLVLLAFMFYLNWQLGLIAALVTILAWLVSGLPRFLACRSFWSGAEFFLWPMCWASSCLSLTCSGRSRRSMARRPA